MWLWQEVISQQITAWSLLLFSITYKWHFADQCRYFRLVQQINDREPELQRLTDAELKAKTAEFKHRLSKGATLDDILVEAFAVVREVSTRVLRLRHYDAQMVSRPTLHDMYKPPCTMARTPHSQLSNMRQTPLLQHNVCWNHIHHSNQISTDVQTFCLCSVAAAYMHTMWMHKQLHTCMYSFHAALKLLPI